MKKKTNKRGFEYYEFEDRNGVKCKIQKSSIALEAAIWLGAVEIGLQEFVANRKPAWQPVELQNTKNHTFIANNSIHLNQEQVKELLPILQRFAETGRI